MIKINLLRSSSVSQSGSVVAGAIPSNGAADAEDKKLALQKLISLLIIPIILFGYEKFNLSDLQKQLTEVQTKTQSIQAESSKFGDTKPRVEKYHKDKEKIDKAVDVVRGLARNRLREVKALDAVQSLIPLKTWLQKVTIDQNIMHMEGFTTSDDGIAEFIRVLENSVYFSQVEPKKTSQETAANGSTVKSFELEMHLGKHE